MLKGHEFTPGDLEFLANANFLVSASRDYSTRIWDIKNQRELGKLITFEGSDEWVFITPDGRFDASPVRCKQCIIQREKKYCRLKLCTNNTIHQNLYQGYLRGAIRSGAGHC